MNKQEMEDARASMSLLNFDTLALLLFLEQKQSKESDRMLGLALLAGALKSYE